MMMEKSVSIYANDKGFASEMKIVSFVMVSFLRFV
jgi:hypothetical protein